MSSPSTTPIRHVVLALAAVACASCTEGEPRPSAAASSAGPPSTPATATARADRDDKVSKLGQVEVTARLVEVPDGAIFKRDLYDYATVLKYKVLEVHRGKVDGDTIYVGHYNPFKPRSEAADRRVEGIGGDLRAFRAGQVHRMALEFPIDDHFMGGIVNKYFVPAADPLPIYWAVWTNLAGE